MLPLIGRPLFAETSRLQFGQKVRGQRSESVVPEIKIGGPSGRRGRLRQRPECGQLETSFAASILVAGRQRPEPTLWPAEVSSAGRLGLVNRKAANAATRSRTRGYRGGAVRNRPQFHGEGQSQAVVLEPDKTVGSAP